jgi:hypothetical protein
MFFALKLTTGETLFAEVISADEHAMTIINPMQVTIGFDNQEQIAMMPWVPFATRKEIPIPIRMIFFADPLNNQFFEYYGKVVIQSEMNKIKHEVYNKMVDGNDYLVMFEGLEKMKKVSEELMLKFGIPGPDFSDFESALEKHKEDLVMH